MEEVVEFTAKYSWLFNYKVTDFFIDRVWDNAPKEWLEVLKSWSFEDLRDVPFGTYQNGWPESLKDFISTCLIHSISRDTDVSFVESLNTSLKGRETATCARNKSELGDTDVSFVESLNTSLKGRETATCARNKSELGDTDVSFVESLNTSLKGREAATCARNKSELGDTDVSFVESLNTSLKGRETATCARNKSELGDTDVSFVESLNTSLKGRETATCARNKSELGDTDVSFVESLNTSLKGRETATCATNNSELGDTDVSFVESLNTSLKGREAATFATDNSELGDKGHAVISSNEFDELIDSSIRKGMTAKKFHEVCRMADVIDTVAGRNGAECVVDVGSGLGYLGQVLHDVYKYKVLGLEGKQSHTSGAEKRTVQKNANICPSLQNRTCELYETRESESHFRQVLFDWLSNLPPEGLSDWLFSVPPEGAHVSSCESGSQSSNALCNRKREAKNNIGKPAVLDGNSVYEVNYDKQCIGKKYMHGENEITTCLGDVPVIDKNCDKREHLSNTLEDTVMEENYTNQCHSSNQERPFVYRLSHQTDDHSNDPQRKLEISLCKCDTISQQMESNFTLKQSSKREINHSQNKLVQLDNCMGQKELFQSARVLIGQEEPIVSSGVCIGQKETNVSSSVCMGQMEPNVSHSVCMGQMEPNVSHSVCMGQIEPNVSQSVFTEQSKPFQPQMESSSVCMEQKEPNASSSVCMGQKEPNVSPFEVCQSPTISTSICMVGLHCCGDLTPTMLKYYAKMDCIKSLCVVSCCYHRMKFEDGQMKFKNFPLSSHLKKCLTCVQERYPDFYFTPYSLRLAAQETRARWKQQTLADHAYHTRNVAYRGILESCLSKGQFVMKKMSRKIVHKNDCNSFKDYVHKVSKHIVTPESGFEDHISSFMNNMQELYKDYEPYFVYIEPMTALQFLLQPVLESLIYNDRVCWLREQGLQGAIVPIFDEIISPRNLALVAMKP